MYEWKDKRILITGATHFISAHLIENLIRSGSHVRAFIRYDYQGEWGTLERLPAYIKNKLEVIQGDLTNPEAIDQASQEIDVVFHFGLLDMTPSSYNLREYLEKTYIGTFNVLNYAMQNKVKKIVYLSTAEVYGNSANVPIPENAPLSACSPYISANISAEKLVEGYFNTYELPVVTLRLFNTYGPMQSRFAIIPTIIIQALTQPKILLGDTHAIRDFVYVDDVVRALKRAVEVPTSLGAFINIGSGQGVSIGNIVDKILGLMGSDTKVLFDATRIRPYEHEIKELVADITKAKNLLNWQPETSLENGLKQTIEWFSEHVGIIQQTRSV